MTALIPQAAGLHGLGLSSTGNIGVRAEFGIPRKLVGLIKMCLNETYSIVRIGKDLTSLPFRMA
jgi:hypothetical protein